MHPEIALFPTERRLIPVQMNPHRLPMSAQQPTQNYLQQMGPQVAMYMIDNKPGWIISICEIMAYTLFAIVMVIAGIFMGTLKLVTFFSLNCQSSILVFIFGIIGNYALALSIAMTIPIFFRTSCITCLLLLMTGFGIVSILANITHIVFTVINSNRLIGDCYFKQNIYYFFVAESGIQIFLVGQTMCYISALSRRAIQQKAYEKSLLPR